MAYALGTWKRNQVWRNEESLFYDVTIKSPENGRGLMNYGLTQMEKGDTKKALDYFARATAFTPNYPILEVNTRNCLRRAESECRRRRNISAEPWSSRRKIRKLISFMAAGSRVKEELPKRSGN